ncbi:MAG TPA: glycosyltransferase family 4 protein [Ferruginibacter sp.]|nr:glycosyltransferase family 4 protein [Ferruginibacter sp.]
MKLIFTSYVSTSEYYEPREWLKRIDAYTGILESLSSDHTVIGIERINYEGEYEQNAVQYFFIRLNRKTTLFPFRMHRLVKRLQPDIVFINGLIFPLQVIQLRLKLGRRIKIIVIHRSEKPFKGIKKYLQRLADKAVSAYLFTSSEFEEQWIENGNIDQKKIHEVIHASSVFCRTDTAAARSGLSIDGSPVFLWVGRLNANKDPLTVIKGFTAFLSFQPTAKLYMIYQTEELLPEVSNLIEQDGKAMQSISLVGKIPHQQLQAWYSSADFIISGSHYEGGGISVCEAMSCGCVPVVTDIISFRKMTGPGKCGLLYEPGNDAALLKALSQTRELDLEEERRKTLQQFNEELSFEAIAKKINRVINSC